MNKQQKLLLQMKQWLMYQDDEFVTMRECFEIANNQDRWKVEMFYVHFGPRMADILDDMINGLPEKDNE